MPFIIVSSSEECFMVDKEEEITSGLKDYDWDLDEVSIFEIGKPIEYEIKVVRKQTLVRKDK